MNRPLNRIKDIRWEKDISLDKLSHLTGISKSALNEIENHIEVPNQITMLKVCKGFGLKRMEEVFTTEWEGLDI